MRPTSNGPNRCPEGQEGVVEAYESPGAWICADLAFQLALDSGGLNARDWLRGTHPPDLKSVLAYEA